MLWDVLFADDFDSHKEVTLPNYLSWCPKRYIRKINYNPAGNVTGIRNILNWFHSILSDV